MHFPVFLCRTYYFPIGIFLTNKIIIFVLLRIDEIKTKKNILNSKTICWRPIFVQEGIYVLHLHTQYIFLKCKIDYN